MTSFVLVRQWSEILFRKSVRLPLLFVPPPTFCSLLWILLDWTEPSSATINISYFPSHFPSSSWPNCYEAPWSSSWWVSQWFSPAKSVSEREGGEERRWCSHACSPTAQGPAIARALLASETCAFTHTFLQSFQNVSVQSHCPREKARMHLNYLHQKISEIFNCNKSILIITRWISDGNLLSFLLAYAPKATLPETSISWEASQATSQRSPFDSGFQILLFFSSPDITAPALLPTKAFSGTRDSQPCWWATREMKLLNLHFRNYFFQSSHQSSWLNLNKNVAGNANSPGLGNSGFCKD